jgi:plasmid rolling circle replication initiator protein Rep
MSQTKQYLDHWENELDTLAQKRTASSRSDHQKHEIIFGEGACKDSVRKRPKRKVIDQSVCLKLIDVAKENNETKWIKRYWNTYHCQTNLITHNGKAYGDYCKNRCCSICNAIRKAKLIHTYKPSIETWSDPHFLTLTVKAQPKTNLENWINGMVKAMSLILNRCRKRYLRGKGIKLIGIKSLECNFNPKKKTYNPHFHILCASKDIAETIKREWLELWNRDYKRTGLKRHRYALTYLQNIRKVNCTEEDLIETIKYGAKVMTDPTMQKGKNKSRSPKIYVTALHEIYRAFDRHKLFGHFGFKPKPQNTKTQKNGKAVSEFQMWIFDSEISDYVNIESGQIMTNYLPDNELVKIISKNIDNISS